MNRDNYNDLLAHRLRKRARQNNDMLLEAINHPSLTMILHTDHGIITVHRAEFQETTTNG